MISRALAFALLAAPLAAQPIHDRCWVLTHELDLTACPASAFDELVSCLSSPDWQMRVEVINAFERPGVLVRKDFMTAVLPPGRKAVELVHGDPQDVVRYASGGLSNALTHAENENRTPPPPSPPGPLDEIFEGFTWVLLVVVLIGPLALRIYRWIPRPPPEMRGKL